MSDSFDPLAAEFAALRPRETSPSLRRRLAQSLAADLPSPPSVDNSGSIRRPRFRWIGVIAGVTVVCAVVVVVVLLTWPLWHHNKIQPPLPSPSIAGPRIPGDSIGHANWPVHTGADRDSLPAAVYSWPLDDSPPLRPCLVIPQDLLD
jgi:hypothetical protein